MVGYPAARVMEELYPCGQCPLQIFEILNAGICRLTQLRQIFRKTILVNIDGFVCLKAGRTLTSKVLSAAMA